MRRIRRTGRIRRAPRIKRKRQPRGAIERVEMGSGLLSSAKMHAGPTETAKSADTADATNTTNRRPTPRIKRKRQSRGAVERVEVGSGLLSSMKLVRGYATAAS